MINKSVVCMSTSENELGKQGRNIFVTALWLFLLILVPSFITGVALKMVMNVLQLNSVSSINDSERFAFNLFITVFSPVVAFPMLYIATKAKSWSDCLSFLALNNVKFKLILYSITVAVVFWIVVRGVTHYFGLPPEESISDLKSYLDQGYIVPLAIFTICFMVPIIEELLIRGWLFTELSNTKLGKVGALVSTSLIFTFLHSQYTHVSTFVMLCILSFLLGFMRLKSNNVIYGIVTHIIFNTLVIVSLLYFS